MHPTDEKECKCGAIISSHIQMCGECHVKKAPRPVGRHWHFDDGRTFVDLTEASEVAWKMRHDRDSLTKEDLLVAASAISAHVRAMESGPKVCEEMRKAHRDIAKAKREGE